MGDAWSLVAARYLRDQTICPGCERGPVSGAQCPLCGTALTGPVADELREASRIAAEALEHRQSVIDRLPVSPVTAPAVAAPPQLPPPAGEPVAANTEPIAARASSQISLQSVLAVAGAGLIAVAAIVFNYLNRDLTIPGIRVSIVAAVTLLFLGGSVLLARRGLRFSAEAIGFLGMVFVALDVSSFSEVAPSSVSQWVFAGIGTAVSAIVVVAIGVLLRLRVWLWSGSVGLVLAPAFIGYGADGRWAPILGHLGAVAVTVAVHELVGRLSARYDSALRVDHVTHTVLRLVGIGVLAVQLLAIDAPPAERAVGASLILFGVAVVAALSTRHLLAGLWSFLASFVAGASFAVLPVALELRGEDAGWLLALVPGAVAVLVILVAVARPLIARIAAIRPRALEAGALAAGLVTVAPGVLVGIFQGASLWLSELPLGRDLGLDAAGDVWVAAGDSALVPPTIGAGAWAGVFAAALSFAALAWSTRRSTSGDAAPEHAARAGTILLAVATWFAMLGLLMVATWSSLPSAVHAIVALAVAALAIALLLLAPVARRAPLRIRVPVLVGAHVALLVAFITSWRSDALVVPVGIAIVLWLVALSWTLPRAVRAVHVGVAYGYALIVLARGLDLAGLDTIVVLALTTAFGALGGLSATLLHRLRVPYWYAILVVTLIPFVIGVATVIQDRSGWTALSTTLIFALALTLAVTRRSGLTVVVRAMAAALLVPSLAVVVVCLSSQFLEISGSRVALPVIATIVACAIGAIGLVRNGLRRGGHGEDVVRVIPATIEVASLVTAVIAVLLAVFVPAAGYEIAMLVLLVLGIGSAAARVFAGRRYGWWGAAIAWTGALWCVWALAGIEVVEPYVLPPAGAAILIGAVLVARGRDGVPLVATGLVAAVAPTLVLLAVVGNGEGALAPWRTIAALGASATLLAVGVLLAPRTGSPEPRRAATVHVRRVRIAVLAVAIGAAAGGAIQAVRLGLDRDVPALADPQHLMWIVLGCSALAAVLGTAAAALLRTAPDPDAVDARLRRTRWLLAPALVFLVVGPISAVAPGVLPMWTLWTLTLVVLGLLVVTAVRLRTGMTSLPPAWFTFAAAWCTAVAGWSVRDLNVEWFSLPLGIGLLMAGVLLFPRRGAERDPAAPPAHRSLTTWPAGFHGSWALLAPGIVVAILPSVLATGTNPATWRAILVIVLALASILIGSQRRLAAPFVLSLIALPLEILVVFVTQAIGGEITPLWWWITLATAGALLLVLAVGSERRSAGGSGVAARMRDLR